MTKEEIDQQIERMLPKQLHLVSTKYARDLLRKAFKQSYNSAMGLPNASNQFESRIKCLRDELSQLTKAKKEAEFNFSIARAILDGVNIRFQNIEDRITSLEQGQLDFEDQCPLDRPDQAL